MTISKLFICKITSVLLGLYLLQCIASVWILHQAYLSQTQEYLQQTSKRIHDDISNKNGWDLSRYNADPNVPDTYPIYILSTDGYVIDRWKPIHGFLDTSDTKHLLTYTTPQTITTATQQLWRIYSEPITRNNHTLGVITVANYNPSLGDLTTIDQRLINAAAIIKSKLDYSNNSIAISKIDSRDISYDIAFQVTDQFNKIVAKSNNTNSIDRIPNYIDLSYVGSLLSGPSMQEINDTQTGEKFIFIMSPLVYNTTTTGVLVVGKSIAQLDALTQNFITDEVMVGLILSLIALLLIIKSIKQHILTPEGKTLFPKIASIHFDKKNSAVVVNETIIPIPYATNQYYLLDTVFANPKKRWEYDELLKRFGEIDSTNTRKVYDAMIMVNKKIQTLIGTKLIVARDKTYQINPLLVSKIM